MNGLYASWRVGAVQQRIYWSKDGGGEPVYLAAHQIPSGSVKGKIFVCERYGAGPLTGQEIPGDIMWDGFIYELFNISHAAEFNDAAKGAGAGTMTRQAYIEKMTRCEFAALTAAARFRRETWRPYLENKGLEIHGGVGRNDVPADYKEWISGYTDPNGYPALYGRYYDNLRRYHSDAKLVESNGTHERAVEKNEGSKTWF